MRGDVPRAVVLLSGGLDSYTAAALTQRDGFALYALTARYGQIHEQELAAARSVADALGVERHLEVAVDLKAIGGSALTGVGAVPKGRAIGAGDIPPTYVPARNTVLLSLALAWAEVVRARDLVIGVNALDYSGYPDCRPAFIQAFEALAAVATRVGVQGARFRVRTPLIAMSKGEIITAGLKLGLRYELTRSCYHPLPGGDPCGACDSCQLRAKGFAEASARDPLVRAP